MVHNATLIALLSVGLASCGSKTTEGEAGTGGVPAVTDGGAQGSGGETSSGGNAGTAGRSGSGGATGTGGTGGGTVTGGVTAASGTSGSGGVTSPGGVTSSGGASSGGATSFGGTSVSGGATSVGGRTSPGGATGRGGVTARGGTTSAAGAAGRGGADATGGETGSGTGGASGAAGQPDAGTPPACPTSSTIGVGDNRATLQHGGRSRSYLVYVPRSVDSDTAVPLVLDFHGSGGTSTQQESSSGWREKAEKEGFIVVYPDGVGKAWNVGNCCGEALSGNVDDVGFTRAVIEAVSKAACIDPKRIYATGMSNGAGFVHRLACEAADVIAAVAAASADLVTDPCTPARPISELSVRGLDDTMVAYEGGNTGSTGWYSPGAKGTLELWKEIDQCTGSPDTSRQYCETYAPCSAGVEVTLCSLPSTGHDTYHNAVSFSVPDVAWEMFQRQPMP
ncbi:MAG: hypothetical protein JW940_18020 [Polyangiaceae bacterium]|nr:hypothetical protein [Polyangiaceae bacterium]